jgi:16S rRNA (adenine1518-N6/adenine1519-N6)-dimethyltransferase
MSQHVARKRFGQNFLVDQQVIADIVNAVAPKRSDRVVEIGPGLGALTDPLLQKVDHLHVVEIDRDIVARLQKRYAPDRLTIHAGRRRRKTARGRQPALQHIDAAALSPG